MFRATRSYGDVRCGAPPQFIGDVGTRWGKRGGAGGAAAFVGFTRGVASGGDRIERGLVLGAQGRWQDYVTLFSLTHTMQFPAYFHVGRRLRASGRVVGSLLRCAGHGP